MEYHTGYYFKEERSPDAALFLQERHYRSRGQTVVLSMVAEVDAPMPGRNQNDIVYKASAALEVTGRASSREDCSNEHALSFLSELLLIWMEEELGREATWTGEWEEAAEGRLSSRIQDWQGISFAGCFAVGERMLLFAQGRPLLWRLVRRFGRLHRGILFPGRGDGMTWPFLCEAASATGGALLFATSSFIEECGEALLESLNPDELTDNERIKKRLGELGKWGAARAMTPLGALIIVPSDGGNIA